MHNVRHILCCAALVLGLAAPSYADRPGVLLLAHGGNPQWNEHVTRLAAQVDRVRPTEVAFGMATRPNIQAAVDRLRERGVSEIVAVPLFVSSWSSVITATEYLLGQRAVAPPELAVFAKMKHGAQAGGAGAHHDHAAAGHDAADRQKPVDAPVPIRMASALNDHPVVAEILVDRAQSISRDPATEAVVIVAHGPNRDEENGRWLADMKSIASRISSAVDFASVDYLTLRDDAPKPVRDRATAELRGTVERRLAEGRRVLVVPLLVSFGGIERGLRTRLEGLQYTMPDSGLVPDERLVGWVLAMAGAGNASR